MKKRPAARQASEAPTGKRRHNEAEERKKAILAERSEKIHRCVQIGICALLIEELV